MPSSDDFDPKASEDSAISRAIAIIQNDLTTKDIVKDTAVSGHPIFKLAYNFFPGTSFFFFILYRYFKKSPGPYTRPAIVILALGILFKYTYRAVNRHLLHYIEDYLMSRAVIEQGDEIYNIVLAWVARQNFSKGTRCFQVATNIEHDPYWGMNNFQKKKLKEEPLKYSPDFGAYPFWHKGRLFFFQRRPRTNRRWEQLSLSTFGRNPAAIKAFLEGCKESYLKEDVNKTIIYRVAGAAAGSKSDNKWERCTPRISRPFSSVILDEGSMKSLIDDLDEYLTDNQQRWYNNRGIPYRRGYLLHGPPGTGKSSLSFALAGHYKLRIYCLSLNSSILDDAELAALFGSLPVKCIVLLEDIDSAGLTHQRTQGKDKDKDKDKKESEKGVSLSGLLNCIDGVASQEGRILIMTTNHIEKLDAALIRPGRIDMTIEFTLAKKAQVIRLFRAIYEVLEGDTAPPVEAPEDQDLNATDYWYSLESPTFQKDKTIKLVDQEQEEKEKVRTAAYQVKIPELANQFAAIVPSDEFSPAEIQGYLLRWKRHPETAVEKAAEWVLKTRASKSADHQLTATLAKLTAANERIDQLKEDKETKDDESVILQKKVDLLNQHFTTLTTTTSSEDFQISKEALMAASRSYPSDLIKELKVLTIESTAEEKEKVCSRGKEVLAVHEQHMADANEKRLEEYEKDVKEAEEEKEELEKKVEELKEGGAVKKEESDVEKESGNTSDSEYVDVDA